VTLLDQVRQDQLPQHVAIIMDGNGRWAKARRLPRTAGHQTGALAAERLIRFLGARLSIPYVTLFAFSSENWSRPRAEVAFLMRLLSDFIHSHLSEFVEAGIRLRVIGDLRRVPALLRREVEGAVSATEENTRLRLTIALSYGGRQEIAAAARRIAEEAATGRLRADAVDEGVFAEHLETSGVPDPDLVIRTSGEERLSNFLLWQSAYAELYFTSVLWPDFTPAEFVRAVAEYQKRKRRFGTIGKVDA
jgi:undecaprenyl diphosphate synthase